MLCLAKKNLKNLYYNNLRGRTGFGLIFFWRGKDFISCINRAVAFYDTRRFGEIDARSEGGGIEGVWVYHIDGTGALVLDTDANIYFDFLDYYAIPDAESDFNQREDVNPQM